MINKKGSAALAIVAVILALLVLTIYLVNTAQRECESNRDCSDNAYCGTDYECHQFPEQIVVKESNFILASIIFGVFLVIAAYIFRGGNIPFLKKNE